VREVRCGRGRYSLTVPYIPWSSCKTTSFLFWYETIIAEKRGKVNSWVYRVSQKHMSRKGLVFISAHGGRNRGSHQFLNWWQQHVTDMLHFKSSSPCCHIRKTVIPDGITVFLGLAVIMDTICRSLWADVTIPLKM